MPITLEELVARWRAVLDLAHKHKRENFQDAADECYQFYGQPNHLFMFESASADMPSQFTRTGGGMVDGQYMPIAGGAPQYCVSVNKSAQYVQVFMPWMYHRNPKRTVMPRTVRMPRPELYGMGQMQPNSPQAMMAQQQFMMAQQQAALTNVRREVRSQLVQDVLNYTPNEMDLKSESRSAIIEALVKGRGVTWHEKFVSPSGGPCLPWTRYDSVDNLFIDPDCERLRNAKWCAQRCVGPVWEVERDHKLPRGTLKGSKLSEFANAISYTASFGRHAREVGANCDMIVYWKIWSRMGIGGRLATRPDGQTDDWLSCFGDYCYLVIAEGHPWPLNLPPNLLWNAGYSGNSQPVIQAASWPIPFFMDDTHPWPFSELDFIKHARSQWPIAPLQLAMGYQRFLNWAMSWMAGKLKRSVRDIAVFPKSLGNELLAAMKSESDFEAIALDIKPKDMQGIKEIISYVNAEPIKADFFNVLDKIEKYFEDATGLTELLSSGQTEHQYRSAEEASVKGAASKARPEDMANTADDWYGLQGRKEAIIAQSTMGPADVAPILGSDGAQQWQSLVVTTDFKSITREFDYGVESGSARRPNVEGQIENSKDASQFVLPVLQGVYQQTGDPTQLNAFMEWYSEPRGIEAGKISNFPDLRQQMAEQQQAAQQQEQEQAGAEGDDKEMEQRHAEEQHEMKKKESEAKIKQGDMKAKAAAKAKTKGPAKK